MKPFNPFVQFDARMVAGFVRMERTYLVAQSYPRGANPFKEDKYPILLSDYSEISQAKDHLNMLPGDNFAAIIHLDNSKHRAKLEEMAAPGSLYLLYVAFARDKKALNTRNDRFLSEAVRLYIAQETNWNPTRGEMIRPVLELNQGELFLKIAYNGEVLKERLSIFEQKLDGPCVTTLALQPPSEPLQITFQNSLLTLK